ncbi:hypothetical protein DL765_004193 [Monosporascus sp. GIB2]|nr:hypothetical protein DL765_004193 [Monosporascus sp. GIB2]
MADKPIEDEATDLKICQARIACPIGHDPKPRTQHRDQPKINTSERRGILRALYDLQARRDSDIPQWAMVDNLTLIHDGLGEAARNATHFYVGAPDGLFAPNLQQGEILDLARRRRDKDGKHVTYGQPFPAMRATARYSFWVMPIGQVRVLVVFELRGKEGTDLAAPRAAEQILEAPRVGIVDVVADGRTERRRTIERRFRLIMPEADIDILDGAFTPITAPTLTTDPWKSGYVVFGVLQSLVQRVNYFVGEDRIDERPDAIFDAVHFDFNDYWIELTRSYMVGALCGRFHRLFKYYSLTAVEVPGRNGDYDPANRQLPPQVGRKKRTITIGELQDMESKGNAKAAAFLEKRRKRQRLAEEVWDEV